MTDTPASGRLPTTYDLRAAPTADGRAPGRPMNDESPHATGRHTRTAATAAGSLHCAELAFRSRVAGPNVVSIHEEGGTAGRPTAGPCFLAGKFDLPACCDSQRNPHRKIGSHTTRKKKDTNHVRYPTKDSARGAQCAARRSPTEKRRYRGPGQHARAAARTALRAEVQMLRQRHQNRLMENSSSSAPFQKGSVADEYPVDVGFSSIISALRDARQRGLRLADGTWASRRSVRRRRARENTA